RCEIMTSLSAEPADLSTARQGIAHKSVIDYAQKMMEIAGHYEGEQTKTYDEETKTAVRSCPADAKCNWARLYPQMPRK
ncbi:hypothetical protein, partial [Ruegeria sp.]|uniref:hypothetical protein n=1 Tax=Ruegeria sp. TaxID=1879320 RepID=UPI002327A410